MMVVRARRHGLVWVHASGSGGRGDKMIDGVIPGVRGRSVFQGRPRPRRGGRSFTGADRGTSVDGGLGTHVDHPLCGDGEGGGDQRRQHRGVDVGQRVVAEADQDLTGTAHQLACH